MIAITVSATKSYLHAWKQCIRSITAAAAHHAEAHFIFATDESKEGKMAEEVAKSELPDGWKVITIRLPIKDDGSENYKEEAQIRIATLQGAAFALARKIRATRVLSVESDNLIPADALRVLEWALDMPTADGSPYYDVAAATYPNGLFLGGFGTPQSPIAEDFLPHERKLPKRLEQCFEACKQRLNAFGVNKHLPHAIDSDFHKKVEKEYKREARLRERAKKYEPIGNVWEVTAKHGWRRRGWMDFAYPGIGRGAIVPSDWCGLGCTLLSQRALALSDFHGYDGRGTQDLFLCWKRWNPAGLRIACVPHVACDHVKKRADGFIEHLKAYHELEGEHRNHLRCQPQPWLNI